MADEVYRRARIRTGWRRRSEFCGSQDATEQAKFLVTADGEPRSCCHNHLLPDASCSPTSLVAQPYPPTRHVTRRGGGKESALKGKGER
eukprot:764820-Hanusia_phi.AAC.7